MSLPHIMTCTSNTTLQASIKAVLDKFGITQLNYVWALHPQHHFTPAKHITEILFFSYVTHAF